MTTRSQQIASVTESRGHYYGTLYGTTSAASVAATVTAAPAEEKHIEGRKPEKMYSDRYERKHIKEGLLC